MTDSLDELNKSADKLVELLAAEVREHGYNYEQVTYLFSKVVGSVLLQTIHNAIQAALADLSPPEPKNNGQQYQ